MSCCGGGGGVLVAGGAGPSSDAIKLFSEQPGRQPPLSRALKEGWVLRLSSLDGRWYEALRPASLAGGGKRAYARLTADALAFYEDRPGSAGGRGRRPTEVIFLSDVSALLGHAKGSDHLRVIHVRGAWWELRHVHTTEAIEDWVKAIASRLNHFRQAARQSQRFTASAMVSLNDPATQRRLKRRRLNRWLTKWMPCCEPCMGTSLSASRGAFALTKRLSGAKGPSPYKGSREGHGDLVDTERLAEVSDPEMQEAQGAHWSDQAVNFLQCVQQIPEELAFDFTLSLRMGAPDGLKRLVWPLAAGEAVVPPKILDRSGASSSTHRDPEAFYAGVCQRAFGDVRPDRLQDPVPTFCQGIQGLEEAPPLSSVVKHLGLCNLRGENALRRLLWCTQLTCHIVEFCPFLPNLFATLLPFFTEAEAMMIVTNVIREAECDQHAEKGSNPRIILSRQQINKQAKLFIREGKKRQNAQEALAHLEELGLDVHALAVELLQDGMAHCLPFRALCRVVGSFLREGSEVLLRYALALIKLRTPEILACRTAEEAKQTMDNLGEGMTTSISVDNLCKAAFSVAMKDTNMARVSSFWGSEYVAPKALNYRQHIFCRPRLFPPRGRCPDELWEGLWSWVPTSCRIFDPFLVYTPSMHGTSMRTCLENCKKHTEAPMIFFVYTHQGDILGGFSPGIWVRCSPYLKVTELRRPVEDAFVFRRMAGSGEVEVFTWSGANQFLMQASEAHGLVFGGDGAAISITKDLVRASTRASATFNSPALVSAPTDEEPSGSEAASALARATSVQSIGQKHADFEMLCFEVFALL